jgi:hypothetical protein
MFMKITHIAFLFLLVSCTTQVDDPFDEFELNQVEVQLIDSFVPDFDLNNPYRILSLDSVIVMHDRISNGTDTYFLRILDAHSGESRRIFGREGRGPQEFLFPIELSRTPGESGVLTANNRSLFEIKKISLSQILDDSSDYVLTIYRNFSNNYSRILALDSIHFFGSGYHGLDRYAIADSTGEITRLWGDYPFPPSPKATTESLPMAYQSRMVAHPQGNLIASVTIKSPNFEVLSIVGDSISYVNRLNFNPVSIKDETNPGVISVTYLEDNLHGYESIDANERFIYALYSGRPYSLDDYRYSDIVIMFDWSGNPVSKIKLPFSVSQLTVDSLGEFIYTISTNMDGEPILSKFKIVS